MGTLFRMTAGRPARCAAAALALAAAGLMIGGDITAQTTAARSAYTATVSSASGTRKGAPLVSARGPIRHLEQNWLVLPTAEYTVFDSLLNAFSYYSGENTPLVWDVASNTLVTIKRGYTGLSDNVYVRTSGDLGQTWTAAKGPLHNASEGMGRYPSITVLNKNNSDKRADLLYHFTFPAVINDNFGITFQGFLDGNLELLSPAESNTGTGGADWSTGAKTVFSADGNVAITASDMSLNNLGIRRFSLATGDLTASIPAAISSSNFSDPQSATSRTSLVVGMERNGSKIYLGIMSRFPATDAENGTRPYPAVSVSGDEGLTWSTLDILPTAVLRSYAQSIGADPDSTIFPYNEAQDFMVTGADEYSFFMNLFEVNADKADAELARQIVEVYRSGGNWGIRKIADISGLIFTFNPISPSTTRENQVANELQAARTADGSMILVKWVDVYDKVVDRDINDDALSPDTLRTSDVFMTMRKTNTSAWNGKVLNVTNSDIIDRITWIPPVVPVGLVNVPLLTLQKKLDGNEATELDRLVNAQLDAEAEQLVTMTSVDASNLAGVSNRDATSGSGMSLSAAVPNPVTERALINYHTPAPAGVTIDVWNARGERVATLVHGRVAAGDNNAMVDARGLAAGVYFVTMSSSGETLSSTFTVVR